MDQVGNAIGAVFGGMGLLFAALGTISIVQLLRRTSHLDRLWVEGVTGEAEVLETHPAEHRHPDSQEPHGEHRVVLGFRTADGRDIRIDVPSRVQRAAGDRLKIRYVADHPEEAVLADSVNPARTIGTIIGITCLALLVLAGLLMAALGFGAASLIHDIPDH